MKKHSLKKKLSHKKSIYFLTILIRKLKNKPKNLKNKKIIIIKKPKK